MSRQPVIPTRGVAKHTWHTVRNLRVYQIWKPSPDGDDADEDEEEEQQQQQRRPGLLQVGGGSSSEDLTVKLSAILHVSLSCWSIDAPGPLGADVVAAPGLVQGIAFSPPGTGVSLEMFLKKNASNNIE